MFQAGDLIIYSSEGVCRVEAIGIPNTTPHTDRLYYTLSPVYREGKIFIPVDTKVFMRPILSREAAMDLIRHIPRIDAQVPPDRNLRALNEHYQSLMQTHQCEDLVQIIKTVYLKQENLRSHGKKICQVDERYMKRAEDMLHGELAISLGIPREHVADFIHQTIEENK